MVSSYRTSMGCQRDREGIRMKTPVVFIHWIGTDYLSLAIKQANKYNDVLAFIDPRPINYSMEVDRWFVLRDRMAGHGIQRCVYIDSDVLLYKDISDDFLDCDMAFSKGHSGHTMFINNFKALDSFCAFIKANYEMGDHKAMIERTRHYYPEGLFADAVGDMVLLNNFMLSSDFFFMDTSKVYNGCTYDHNINTEGIPFIGTDLIPRRATPSGDTIKLNSLHFQGAAKEYMKVFIND